MSVFTFSPDIPANTALDRPSGKMELAAVDIQANVRGLFTDITTTQVFENNEATNIEAVYTFPLPLDAVLLELTVELNGQTLKGTVQPKVQAESSYEEAIDEGGSAILLEQVEPGLYTVNAGNLLAGERATVVFRYGLLLNWQDETLRLQLPTTIAPRYGDPLSSGMAHHQVPEYTLQQDTTFTLSVNLFGEHAQANILCPSHQVIEAETDGIRTVTLAGTKTPMDRDFILQLQAHSDAGTEAFQAVDQDGQHVVLASFQPKHCALSPEPRCIKLVVDCSSSMAGDSIAQAKVALHEILSLLKSEDYFNLTTFGCDHRLLFARPVAANEENIKKASLYVENIDADMGGTEMSAALSATCGSSFPANLPSDVLLITDGEVWSHEQVIANTRHSHHRVFSVGVGSAVSEPFVRGIAAATSGACELVSPRENMAERIVRHFKRIDHARVESVNIEWPSKALHQTPEQVTSVFAGDTIHVFGWLQEPLNTAVLMTAEFIEAFPFTQKATLSGHSNSNVQFQEDLVRLAAHQRLKTLKTQDAEDLAVRYQLLTEQTSCILVIERTEDEKADNLPELRKIKNTLAAGHAGIGSVGSSLDYSKLDRPAVYRRMVSSVPASSQNRSGSTNYVDTPAFLCRQVNRAEPFYKKKIKMPTLKDELREIGGFINHQIDNFNDGKIYTCSIDSFVSIGLIYSIEDDLYDLVEGETTEPDIVIAFLVWLSEYAEKDTLSRHMKRLVRQASNELPPSEGLVESIDKLIQEAIKMRSLTYRVKKALLHIVKPSGAKASS